MTAPAKSFVPRDRSCDRRRLRPASRARRSRLANTISYSGVAAARCRATGIRFSRTRPVVDTDSVRRRAGTTSSVATSMISTQRRRPRARTQPRRSCIAMPAQVSAPVHRPRRRRRITRSRWRRLQEWRYHGRHGYGNLLRRDAGCIARRDVRAPARADVRVCVFWRRHRRAEVHRRSREPAQATRRLVREAIHVSERLPRRGTWSNTQRPSLSISPEDGVSLGVTARGRTRADSLSARASGSVIGMADAVQEPRPRWLRASRHRRCVWPVDTPITAIR